MLPTFWGFAFEQKVVIVKRDISQKNYLEKLHSFKKQIYSEFVWLEGRDVCDMMSKLGHYHYNKNKFILLGKEKEIYDFLIKHSYNPYTIYRWLLLERIPEDIKHQLKNKEMCRKKPFLRLSSEDKKQVNLFL